MAHRDALFHLGFQMSGPANTLKRDSPFVRPQPLQEIALGHLDREHADRDFLAAICGRDLQ
jgi:hypothetical protein